MIHVFIQHKTLPGKRDDVQRVWQKHMTDDCRQLELAANGFVKTYPQLWTMEI